MSRDDELKVGSSQWPERDMFLSHMGCISLITMKQIKSYVFLAIFDQCPILTCPGMTNYHNISDLDKTCCVNCTELHSSLLTIISTHIFLCLIKSVICDGFQNWSWSSKGVLRQQWTGCKTEQVKMKKWLTSLAITRMSVISMMMNKSNTQYFCHKLKNRHSKRYLEYCHSGTFGKNGWYDISRLIFWLWETDWDLCGIWGMFGPPKYTFDCPHIQASTFVIPGQISRI